MRLHPDDGISVENTLHHALGPFLMLSQFFGILPVVGAGLSRNVADVRFRWRSLTMLVTAFFISYAAINVFLAFGVVFERGLKLYTAGPFTFSIMCLVGYCVFLQLSRNWPNLIAQSRRLEVAFLRKYYLYRDSYHYSRTIRRYGVLLLVGALMEHFAYQVGALYSNAMQIEHCNLTIGFWDNFFMRERLHIFSIIPFSMWLVPLVEWITIAMTFTWNFVDIFLILVCLGLSMRFRQLHWRVQQNSNKLMPDEFWAEVRNDFMALTDLLGQLDDHLSGLILLSFSQNMYFICDKVFLSFIPKSNVVTTIYFWISFVFVLTRILTMMFAASAINEAAGEILTALYEIPTAFWGPELNRLNEILASDLIALSGRRFFFVTRHLIFGMAGTIVVYELVLFDQVEEVVDNRSNYCPSRKW